MREQARSNLDIYSIKRHEKSIYFVDALVVSGSIARHGIRIGSVIDTSCGNQNKMLYKAYIVQPLFFLGINSHQHAVKSTRVYKTNCTRLASRSYCTKFKEATR